LAEQAPVTRLVDYRLERQRETAELDRLPVVLAAHPDAVSLTISGEYELWLKPDQAEGLGHDLLRLARAARGGDRG
jgi:hypothetical protein